MNWLKEYIASPTHQWWVDHVWKPSLTKITTAIYGLPALFVTFGQAIGKIAGDDKISQYLSQMHVPNYVFAGLAGIALVHYIASGHKD